MTSRTAVALAAAAVTLLVAGPASAQRAMGVDVSHYQGSINWASVQAAGKSFAFIKATEADYSTDAYFASNVSKLSATSMVFGAYHFARPPTATTTTDAALAADAVAEANYFVNTGRSAMQPGNLLPTLDLESGQELSNAQLTTWTLAFSDQMYARIGVRPMVYANSNYSGQVNAGAVSTLPLWWARVPTSTTGYTDAEVSVSTRNPTTSYGAWGTSQTAWKFWQYSWVGSVAGIGGNVDLDVAHGDIEYVKDLAIAAVWTDASGGNFGGAGKWNNFDGAAGTLFFPNANSRAIISLPNANPTITYDGANRVARSLVSDEAMSFSRGTLDVVQYATLNADVSVSGGGLTAATMTNTKNLTVSGTGNVVVSGAITYPLGTSPTITVSGGTLSAASVRQSQFTVSGGTATIAGELGGNFVNVSAGTLSAGSINISSSMNVSGGVATVGTLTAFEPTAVRGSGVLNVGTISRASLTLADAGQLNLTGTGGSKVTRIAIANTARLDLGLTELAVDYIDTSPLAGYRDALAAGAITSNKAIAGVLGIGAIEAAAKFGASTAGATFGDDTGVAVDATTVLLSLALFGDANLDRVVDVGDLGALASGYGTAGGWAAGDANYDGVIDVSDLGALASNYGRTLLADGTFTGANAAQFARDVQLFSFAVPEPTSLAAVSLLGVALRRRRR